MDGPFMCCGNLLVYGSRFNDERRLVIQNMKTDKSIIIPPQRWADFVALCPDIDEPVDSKYANFRKSFGDNLYVIVKRQNVVLREETDGLVTHEIELDTYYWECWDNLMRDLPQLMPEVPDLFVDFSPWTMRRTREPIKPGGYYYLNKINH